MRARLGVVLFAVHVLGGCQGTEIVVGIVSDVGNLNRISLAVRRDGEPLFTEDWSRTAAVSAASLELPGSYGLVIGSGTPEIEVELRGFIVDDPEPVLERRSVVTPVAGRTDFLRMALANVCAGVVCGDGTTCIEGACLDPHVETGSLPAYQRALVGALECDSGPRYTRTSDGTPLSVVGSCAAGERCQEGICTRAAPKGPGASIRFGRVREATPAGISLAAGDLDGDGELDLVLPGPDGAAIYGVIDLLRGGAVVSTPWGTQPPSTVFASRNLLQPMALHDFDSDGKLDLVLVEVDANRMGSGVVYRGRGDGGFDRAAVVALGETPSAIQVVDLDGDGDGDLVVTNVLPRTIRIFLGRGDGSFTPGESYAVDLYPLDLAVGDFDADGRPDLTAVVVDQAQERPGQPVSQLLVFPGRGDGGLGTPQQLFAARTTIRVIDADLDGNGWLDLLTLQTVPGQVNIFLNQGKGVFAPFISQPMDVIPPTSVALADFDLDGQLDLALVRNSFQFGAGVMLFRGVGGGAFETVRLLRTPGWANEVVARDFDGDGRPDLAIATNDGVSVMFGGPP